MTTRLRVLLFAIIALVPGVLSAASRIISSGSCPGPCCK